MLKNIAVYLCLLACAFLFNIFYFEWFSWILFLILICVPILSILISMPFMIKAAVNGVVIESNGVVNINSVFKVKLKSNANKFLFFPLIKIKLSTYSSLGNKNKNFRLSYCGNLGSGKPEVKLNFKKNDLTRHSASIRISKKYCRVYDFLGLFFIPVKSSVNADCLVLPREIRPKLLPDKNIMKIKTYKKGMTSSNDIYDIRKYRSGDEVKNIHWKLSAKYNDLYIKEPLLPVYYTTAVKPVYNDNPDANDDITARLIYVSNYCIKRHLSCCAVQSDGSIFRIHNQKTLFEYLRGLFENTPVENSQASDADISYYLIMQHGEEVQEI